MDIAKIGKFISELGKQKGMTQKDLASKLDVTDKAVSRWETGKGLPDSSLWQTLGSALDISVNELLSGERIDAKIFARQADKALVETVDYTKKRAKSRMMMLGVLAVCLSLFLLVMLVLSNNNSFFKGYYSAAVGEKQVIIPVPKYSFHRGTGGQWIATFKTLKNHNEVSLFINRYLARLEAIEANGETAYYDSSQDITIYNYSHTNDGIGMINTIYIGYEDGRLAKQ